DYARADRGPRAARGAGGGAAPARARELRARRARRGGRRRVGSRRGPSPSSRVSRRRRRPGRAPRSPPSPSSLPAPRRLAAVSHAPCIYISAGEPSGDAHAAAVVAALKRRLPGASVEAFGGPDLEAAGAAVLDRLERFSVVGFVEALWMLPAHLRLLGRVRLAFQA